LLRSEDVTSVLTERNAKSFAFSEFWRERLEPGLFVDTRPRHGQVTEMRGDMYASKENRIETPCPRQRFFVEARKRDDGDVGGIEEER
jgi:hypothetical protein